MADPLLTPEARASACVSQDAQQGRLVPCCFDCPFTCRVGADFALEISLAYEPDGAPQARAFLAACTLPSKWSRTRTRPLTRSFLIHRGRRERFVGTAGSAVMQDRSMKSALSPREGARGGAAAVSPAAAKGGAAMMQGAAAAGGAAAAAALLRCPCAQTHHDGLQQTAES